MANNILIAQEEDLRNSVVSDFDHNYFVEAGAGAGKTSLIVDRITAQLESGKYTPEEIVAITFTNKAAQERNERIRGNLKGFAAKNPTNASAQEAVKNIGRMQISTIHSFCHRILKENCFDAKLCLDFELLEEEDTAKMKRRFFMGWMNANASRFVDMAKTIQETDPEHKNEVSYSDLESNFENICELPDNVNFIFEDPKNVSTAVLQAALQEVDDLTKLAVDEYIKEIDKLLKTSAADNTPIKNLSYSDPAVLPYLVNDCVPCGDCKVFFKAIKKEPMPFRKRGYTINGTRITIGNSCKDAFVDIGQKAYTATENKFNDVKNAMEKLDHLKRAQLNTLMMQLLLDARKEYRLQLFNREVTNDLLLQKTNDLLNNAGVLEKIRSTFKCIYVDEFQDTDPVQNELIMKIARKDGKFIPGLLFVVGDVKQSIYRFREADYRLFNKTKEEFEKNSNTCKVVSLNINNRSNADLVDYFNNKVKAQPVNMPGYVDMVPRKEHRPSGVIHGVYKVIDNCPDDAGAGEPGKLVTVIKRLVGNVEIMDYDSKAKKESKRTVEYRDILILTSKRQGLSKYVDILQGSGIPARISVDYFPGNMQPVKRFVNIYRYLAMPFYRRAKEGILEIAQQNTSINLNEFTADLQAWKAETGGMTGAELAGWLLEQGEKYLFEAEDIEGCKVKRCQMAIRQMIETVVTECDDNPAMMAKAFLEYVDDSNAISREMGYDKKENAVRLMNIHKAKGLEGSIVIIADREEKKKDDTTYTEDKNRYQVLSVEKPSGFGHNTCSAYELNSAIKTKASLERDMEAARLEYVAVTRAKEALIFMGADNPDPVFSVYIDENVSELFGEDFMEEKSDDEADATVPATPGTPLIHAAKPTEDMSEPTGYRISPSGVEIHPSYKPEEKQEATEAAIALDEDDVVEEAQAPEDASGDADEELVSESSELLQKKVAGDIYGTIMHRAFELAVQGIRKGNCNAALCINRAISENNDDIEVRYPANAAAWRNSTMKSLEEILPKFIDFISDEVTAADEVYTEFPFLIKVSGAELVDMKSKLQITSKISKLLPADGKESSTTLWLSGTADLLIWKGDQLTVWDYKSDLKADGMTDDDFRNSIHSKYDNQMNLYKWVMAKNFPCNIVGKFYTREIGEA